MKTVLLEEPKRFRLTDTPEPPAPGPGEALVRVHRVGICGTDYSGYLGKMPFYSYPRIPGHELGVEVVAVGPDVTNVKPGDRCAVEPYINCQQCFACRTGHNNCCENHQTLGVHCDGGLRSHFIVPARKLHVSTKLTFEQLALVETLAIGCHAVDRGQPQPGEHVLIIGAGPIGLSALEFARLTGAHVVLLDVNPQRLEFARDALKVADTLQVQGNDQDIEALKKLTEGNLGQVVIDATGNHLSMSRALEFVGFAGRLVYVGVTSKEISFPHPLMHRREMTLLASRNAMSPDFSRIIKLIEEGRIDTRPWITHQTDLEGMIAQFPEWLKPESRVLKAVVKVEA